MRLLLNLVDGLWKNLSLIRMFAEDVGLGGVSLREPLRIKMRKKHLGNLGYK